MLPSKIWRGIVSINQRIVARPKNGQIFKQTTTNKIDSFASSSVLQNDNSFKLKSKVTQFQQLQHQQLFQYRSFSNSSPMSGKALWRDSQLSRPKNVSDKEFQRANDTLEMVKDLFVNGQFQKVIEICSACLNEHNWSPVFLIARAESFENLELWKQSIEDYKKLNELFPYHLPSYVGMARSLKGMGNITEAKKIYDQAIYFDPTFGPAALGRARLNEQLGNYKDALEDMKRYLTYKTEDKDALILYAELLFSTGKLKEAFEMFSKVLSIDSNNLIALKGVGMCSFMQGSYENAIEHWKKALLDDSLVLDSRADLLLKKATAHYHLKQFSEALSDSRESLIHALKTDPLPFYAISQNLIELNSLEYQEIVEKITSALDINSQSISKQSNDISTSILESHGISTAQLLFQRAQYLLKIYLEKNAVRFVGNANSHQKASMMNFKELENWTMKIAKVSDNQLKRAMLDCCEILRNPKVPDKTIYSNARSFLDSIFELQPKATQQRK